MTVSRRAFMQQLGLGALQLGVVSALPTALRAEPLRSIQLPRSTPEAQGVASSGILRFVEAIEAGKLNVHSLMVVRHGKVVAEGWWAPYAPTLRHTLYSLSKSFTSTAVGLAVGEGRLNVTDKVISFFPDDLPATVSPNLAAMRVKDLLTMSTGHEKDTTARLRESSTWVKSFLSLPVEKEPGSLFVYNSGATYMLSAIVQKLTGQTVLQYLTPRLFRPLGIEGADWEQDPSGINTGGWGLRLKTEDIAKFGQLYLQKGMWNGKRLISENWIADATRFEVQSAGGSRPKAENDWLQGYGYQFWRCRNNAYRGDGAYGQYCIVVPEQDLVIAMTSETGNMQAILDEVWNHILPAATTAGPDARTELKQKLASLRLPVAEGSAESPLAEKISGKSFRFDTNELQAESISLAFSGKTCQVTWKDKEGAHPVAVGLGSWKEGTTNLSTEPLKLASGKIPGETTTRIAASGAWKDADTFVMTWRFNETAHYENVTCRFKGDTVEVSFLRSISILTNTKDTRPVLTGKLV
ncbi:MAG: serine hydrolase [Siphonobacter aquaeclarae]|nr:serine hydrolase [Siphonobacter aquaeclarae]